MQSSRLYEVKVKTSSISGYHTTDVLHITNCPNIYLHLLISIKKT